MLSATLIITTLFISANGDILTLEEQTLMTDFIQAKNIHNCVFLQDENFNISLIKMSSSLYLTAIYKSIKELQNSILNENFSYHAPGTLIIYKPRDLEQFMTMAYFLAFSRKINFFTKFTWLLFLTQKNFPFVTLPLVPYGCEFIVARDYNFSSYILYKYYMSWKNTITGSEPYVSNTYGFWTKNQGLTLIIPYRFERFTNMNQTMLLACFNECYNNMEHGLNIIYCWQSELLKDLFRTMNFRYNETHCAEKFVDVMVEPVPFYLDFRIIQRTLKINSYVKYLPMKKMDWYIKYPIEEVASDFYIQPFHTQVWMSIIGTIILGGLLLVIIDQNDVQLKKRSRIFHIFDDIFAVHAFFCAQNKEDKEDQKKTCKIVFLAFSFLVLYIVPSYSADLTAYLSVRLKKVPFTDLQSFVENGEYKLLMTSGFHELNNFKRRNDSIRLKILEKSLVLISGLTALKDIICHEKIAFAMYDSYKISGQIKCRLFKIKNPIQIDYFGILMGDYSSPSPFAGIINHKFLKMIEGGILQKLEQIKAEYDIAASLKEEEEFQPIEFGQIYEILSIMVTSFLISLIIFISELMVYNWINLSK